MPALIDRYAAVLLDMHRTFMFGVDRFGPGEDFAAMKKSADLRGFKVFVERTGEDLTGWRGTIPAPRDAAERTAAGGSA